MKRTYLIITLIILLPALLLSACSPAPASTTDHQEHGMSVAPISQAEPSRTIAIDANDRMRFTPENLTVRQGETVIFAVTNTGRVPHEFVMGNDQLQAEHAQVMAQAEHGGTHHGGQSTYALTILPGETVHLTYTVDQSGPLFYGCHIPGHYAAGMKGVITVTSIN